jgi:hypothetical protein
MLESSDFSSRVEYPGRTTFERKRFLYLTAQPTTPRSLRDETAASRPEVGTSSVQVTKQRLIQFGNSAPLRIGDPVSRYRLIRFRVSITRNQRSSGSRVPISRRTAALRICPQWPKLAESTDEGSEREERASGSRSCADPVEPIAALALGIAASMNAPILVGRVPASLVETISLLERSLSAIPERLTPKREDGLESFVFGAFHPLIDSAGWWRD